MTRRALWFTLLLAPALLFGAYTYYYSDTLTSINPTYWTTNGNVTATSNGLTASSANGGSIISLVTAPTPPNEYEVKTTLRLTASGVGGTFVHYLRASADAMTGPSAQGTFYSFELSPAINAQGVCSATLVLNKRVGGIFAQISSVSGVPCHDGMEMRSAYTNGTMLVFLDGACYMHVAESTISAGQPGVGSYATPSGNSISSISLGPHDGIAPEAVDRNTLAVTAFPTRVEMQWKGAVDDANGRGLWRYLVYRNWTFVAVANDPEFVDHATAASQTYTYQVIAQDQHANGTWVEFNVTTPPADAVDPRRVGVRPTGSYWGASGEQIDMLSGNLNFTMPLLTAKGRNGLTATLALNYNSQVWRQDAAGTWRFGKDLGYGFGWRLMLGSITPYWSDQYTLHHYIYTDSTGAEYRLDVNSNNVWRSQEGIYVWYDANTSRLYFRDGTFWVMGAVSAGTEQDAGTRYPSLIQDTNGNQIAIEYKAGLGVTWANSSARIYRVKDVRNITRAYEFTYNTDAIPHLTGITNYIWTSEGYTFAYAAEQELKSPFSPFTQFGSTRMLSSVTTAGLNLTHQFAYGTNNAGELTKVTFPYGGYLEWEYTSQTLSGSRTHREVWKRWLAKNGGTERTGHTLSRDPSDVWRTVHQAAWLEANDGPAGQKQWVFLNGTGTTWREGLQDSYEDRPAPWQTATRSQTFTWAQDAGANPYISVATTTLNPGQTYEKISKVEQTLDGNGWGNVLQTRIYNYGDLVNPARTYTNTYLTDSNHTNRYIRNRVLTTVVAGGGQSLTLEINTYGGSYGGLADITSPSLHDPTYGATFAYRGNLVSRTVPGKPTAYYKHDIVGNVTQTTDLQGHYVDVSYSSTDYKAPGVVTPNANTDLASSFTYTSFLGIASATAPNASTTTYTYNSYARPTSSTSPHGAVTNYTYNDTPLAATETATTNGKWVKKYKDGLGRVVLVETGYGTTTVSKVATEYAPCSCSPLGRVYRVSQPYTGDNPTSWTTYAYDALGRTTCVSLPANSGSTTYLYEGNVVTVTDPAGRWKKYDTDVFGNVVKVTEPNPQGGANHETTYAYDMFNHLTTVTMPRGGVTQTRTFTYNTLGQLVSTANPENGTTTLAYNTDGMVASKTDQKGQRIEYTYDSYRRVTQVKKYPAGQQSDDPCQRVNYYYDTNPYESGFTQNGWGRLAVVEYGRSSCAGKFRESYSYTSGGLPVKKKLRVEAEYSGTGELVAQWSYDNEGKMLTVKYPDTQDNNLNVIVGRTYTQSYDAMGRPVKVTDNQEYPVEWAKDVVYGPAGELTQLREYDPVRGYETETRSYNARLQVTGIQWGPGFVGQGGGRELHYYYNDTANDGRIRQLQRVDHSIYGTTTTTTTDYLYDELGRLKTAGAASYTYDGFGNRLTQTAPSMNLTYNASNNRITTAGYTYDANGNVTATPELTLAYDVENRLVEAVHATNGTERYAYAPNGQRVWKSGWQGGIYFYGVDGKVLGLYRLTEVYYGEPGTEPVWFDVMQEQWTNVYLGGRMVRTGNQPVVEDRLGTVNGPATNPYGDGQTYEGYGFTGYYHDGITGFDYAQQRYYAPALGRFTTPDPYQASAAIARPQSWNRYAYVENDPVNFVDPSGLFAALWSSDLGGGWGPDLAPPFVSTLNVFTLLPTADATGRFDGPPAGGGGGGTGAGVIAAASALDRVKGTIADAISPDSLFSADVMDCISGIETGRKWDPSDTRYRKDGSVYRVGLYQFDEITWNDTARQIGASTAFETGASDISVSTVMAQALLYIKLRDAIGEGPSGLTSAPTEAQLTEAIDRFGEHNGRYGVAVMDCTRSLAAGNFAAAYRRLVDYANGG